MQDSRFGKEGKGSFSETDHPICPECQKIMHVSILILGKSGEIQSPAQAEGTCTVCGKKDTNCYNWLPSDYEDPRIYIKEKLSDIVARMNELAPLVEEYAALLSQKQKLVNLHLTAEHYLTKIISRRVDNGDIFQLLKVMSSEEKAILKEKLKEG